MKVLRVLAMLLFLVGAFPLSLEAAPLPTFVTTVPIDPITGANSYSSCINTVGHDTVTVDVNPGQLLKGFISVDFVVPPTAQNPTGRVAVPNSITIGPSTYNSPIFVNPSGGGPLVVPAGTDLTVTTNYPPVGSWPSNPGGGKEVHASFSFEVYEGGVLIGTVSYGFDVYCGTPPPPPPPPSGTAPRTPGYWKNHLTWPITSIKVGCTTVGQITAVDLLGSDAKDMTYKLASHLIAAELNVAAGAPTSIQSTIDAANAFLCAHPLGSDPKGADRTAAENLKNQLEAYNTSQGG